jgi:hypothetical protein
MIACAVAARRSRIVGGATTSIPDPNPASRPTAAASCSRTETELVGQGRRRHAAPRLQQQRSSQKPIGAHRSDATAGD